MAPEARGAPFSKHLAALVGAAALAAMAAHPPAVDAAELSPWTEGPQPTFTLPAAEGGADVALAAQQGDAVLVHFFATWCEPCREELPALKRLSERAGPSLKVLIVSVAEVDIRVQRFLQATPLGLPVLLDRDRAVAKAWKVATLPTTFVLDKERKPRFVVEADYAWDKVDPKQLIDSLSTRGKSERPRQQNTLTLIKEGPVNELR